MVHLSRSHWLGYSTGSEPHAWHSCLSMPSKMSVTQGGLGNLNFIRPLLKVEVSFQIVSSYIGASVSLMLGSIPGAAYTIKAYT